MLRSIIPKEEAFFDNFVQICVLIVESAEKLKAMLKQGRPFDEFALNIKKIEREVDQKVQQTVVKLRKTFVTPFDRQDILKLATGSDLPPPLTSSGQSMVQAPAARLCCGIQPGPRHQ